MKVNRVLSSIPRVGSRTVEQYFAQHPAVSRLPLLSYPIVTPPEHLVAAAALAIRAAEIAEPAGLPQVRQRLATELAAEGDAAARMENIVVTAGAMAALQTIWLSILDPGDEVVVPTPTYYAEGSIRLAGGTCCFVEAVGWSHVDWTRVEAAINERSTAIFVTNPNNPTGKMLGPSDFDSLVEICKSHPRLWLVVDESYERMTHTGRRHLNAWLSAALRERSIIVRSFSKSFALTWLRLGWLVAPEWLVGEITKVIEWGQLYGSSLNQRVGLAALEGDRGWLTAAFEALGDRGSLLRDAIVSIKGCETMVPEAGPFLYVYIAAVRTQNPDVAGALIEAGLPIVPGRYFGSSDDWFRIPFGGEQSTVARAGAILHTLLKPLHAPIARA